MEPSYLSLHTRGQLAQRARQAVALLRECRLCPRGCGADRLAGEPGACGTGRTALVASFDLHYGEEDPLVGEGGSGTIFFSRCNLGCVFCQNWEISRGPEDGGEPGTETPPGQLARMMLELARRGAENINLVSPSHVVPQVLEALALAAEEGLRLPVVYNSGGYDAPQALELLDGVVDIYMPDVKFWDRKHAARYCGAADYPERAREAVAQMHRQVGDLVLDEGGVARRGVLVRHLVLPGGLAGTPEWMEYLAGLSTEMYVNVMGQYHPCGRAREYPELSRPVTRLELDEAREAARRAGIHRLDRRRGGVVRFLMRELSRNG